MADCTCANPGQVAQEIKSQAEMQSNAIEAAAITLDETLYGATLGVSTQGTGVSGASSTATEGGGRGQHGALGPVRFCNWAAPEWGTGGESVWTNLWQAAQLAIALLNASIQGQIAEKQQDLAEGYYQQAKFKWDRFRDKYMPLEKELLKEVSTVAEPQMNCVDDRARAETAVDTAYDTIAQLVGQQAKALRICIDDSILRQLDYGRALALVDTENYNLRDDTWYTDFKSDQRWGRRSNVLNLGRNLGSIAMQYGKVARALAQDVGSIADRAATSLSMAVGYYGARFDTVYPTSYLGTNGGASNMLVNTTMGTHNAASGGF